MITTDPFHTVDTDSFGPRDRVQIWRAPTGGRLDAGHLDAGRLDVRRQDAEQQAGERQVAGPTVATASPEPPIDFLAATFADHSFAPHSHDTYGIGITLSGCQTHRVRGVRQYARPGTLWLMEPGEVHDGQPYGGVYSYRMTYPARAVIDLIVGEVTGRPPRSTVAFAGSVVGDPVGLSLLLEAHEAARRMPGTLAGDESLFRAYAHILRHHSNLGAVEEPATARHDSPPDRAIAEVRALLEDRFAENIRLDDLSDVAGRSRFRVVRDFKRAYGLTPHAYLIDARVRRARALLSDGEAVASVASTCGFADQSHLTRVFKARVGVTPGAYARA